MLMPSGALARLQGRNQASVDARNSTLSLAREAEKEAVLVVVVGGDALFRAPINGAHAQVPPHSEPPVVGLGVIDQGQVRLDAIAARGDDGTWLSSVPRVQLLATAEKIEKHPGAKTLPLYGIPFAVKDSIDVEGVPTTLSCPGYAYVVSSTARSVLRDRLRCLLISAGREGPG